MIAALQDAVQIEQMKLIFLGIGFAVVWIGIAGYLMSISRRQRALERNIADLRSRAEDTQGGPRVGDGDGERPRL